MEKNLIFFNFFLILYHFLDIIDMNSSGMMCEYFYKTGTAA